MFGKNRKFLEESLYKTLMLVDNLADRVLELEMKLQSLEVKEDLYYAMIKGRMNEIENSLPVKKLKVGK